MMLENTKKYNSKTLLIKLVALASCVIGISNFHDQKSFPKFELSPQESTVHINENFLKIFSLGQTRLLSSILWSETLLRADLKHYENKDLNNWMFLRLKLITTLDPYFYVAYLYGGVYLSIIKDDLLGASYIYNKGLQNFPDDFDLNFNAAFHFNYEVGDFLKAVPLLEKIKNHPRSTPAIKRVLSRLKAEQGSLDDSYLIIRSLYQAAPADSEIQRKYERNLFSIKTEMDLNCLNSQKSNCSERNLKGIPYVKGSDGKWASPSSWKPYRIKNKKGPQRN